MNTVQPFRDPDTIRRLLSDPSAYNVFFVFTHGQLVASTTRSGSFDPEENNILISAGAGQPGCSVWVGNAIDQAWIDLFDPRNIRNTFGILLGFHPGLNDLMYKVHGDVPKSPEYVLSFTDEDIKEGKGIWGVFRHTGNDFQGEPFDNVVEEDDLSKEARGTFASNLLDMINAKYPTTVNIVLFGSCRHAFRGKAMAKTKDFANSAAALFAASHFHIAKGSTNLDIPNTNEECTKQPIRVYMKERFSIVMEPKDRVLTVQDFLKMINERFTLEIKGLYILPILNGKQRFVWFENEALFGAQIEKEYLETTEEGLQLQVYPSYDTQRNRARSRRSKATVDPEQLERAEIRRRGNLTKKRKRTK